MAGEGGVSNSGNREWTVLFILVWQELHTVQGYKHFLIGNSEKV